MVRCTWDRINDQAAEQTAHPSAVRAGGRVLSSNGCTQIDEEPFLAWNLSTNDEEDKVVVASQERAHPVGARNDRVPAGGPGHRPPSTHRRRSADRHCDPRPALADEADRANDLLPRAGSEHCNH